MTQPLKQIGLMLICLVLLTGPAGAASDADNDAVWQTLRPAMLHFQDGGPRVEFLAVCRRLLAEHPGSRYETELQTLVQPMAREEAAGVPDFMSKPSSQRSPEESIRYWIYQLREEGGHQVFSPGYPELYALPGKSLTPANQLVAIGPPAIPFLVAALDDNTPTRTIAWQREFYPVYFVLRRQDIAMKCLERITGCQFYDEGATFIHLYMDTPERRDSAISNVRVWWRLSRGASQVQMIRNQLILRDKNITLRGYDRIQDLQTLAMLEGPKSVLPELRRMLAADTFGLNSPIAAALDSLDPRLPVQAAFARFQQNQSRDGDYIYLFKYGNRSVYQTMAQRLGATGKLDPGAWSPGDQAGWAAKYGKNWAIPIEAELLKDTAMTGSQELDGGEALPFSTADDAIVALQQLTGREFGYAWQTSVAAHLAAIEKARAWWEGEGRRAMAAKIVQDHPPVVNPGDLFLSDYQLSARAAALMGQDAGLRRKTLGALGEVYSPEVQRALLIALTRDPNLGERMQMLHALALHPALWHLPALANVMAHDKSMGIRVAAAAIIQTIVGDKTTMLWWTRLESRNAALDAARHLARDGHAPAEVRRSAVDILRAWDAPQDRPLTKTLNALD